MESEKTMYTLEFTREEADALMRCMTYLYATMADASKAPDDAARKELELKFYKSAYLLQNMNPDVERSMLGKLGEMQSKVIEDAKAEAASAPNIAPEVNQPSSEVEKPAEEPVVETPQQAETAEPTPAQ